MYELIIAGDKTAVLEYIQARIGIVLVFWFLIFLACCVDTFTGVRAAKKCNEPLSSHKYRDTFSKIFTYLSVAVFALLFDTALTFLNIGFPYATLIIMLAVLVIEGKSVLENARKHRAGEDNIVKTLQMIVSAVTTKDAQAVINYLTKGKEDSDENSSK